MRYSTVRHGYGARSVLNEMQLTLDQLIREGERVERDDWDPPITPSNRHLLGYPYYEDAGTFARMTTEGRLGARSNNARTPRTRIETEESLHYEDRFPDASSARLLAEETELAMAGLLRAGNYHPTSSGLSRPIILGDNYSDSSEELEVGSMNSGPRSVARPAGASGEADKTHTCECCNGIVSKPKSNVEKANESGEKEANEEVPSTFRWVHIEIV